MLQDNIKTIRKNKGLTQEELAIRLSVVRQTVSKWEKGLSVPDADMLQRMAEVLEVPVSELLGEEQKMEENRNEIAEQLSRINEQLATKNRRAKRLWTVVGAMLGLTVLTMAITLVLNFAAPNNTTVMTFSEAVEVLENTDGTYMTVTKLP